MKYFVIFLIFIGFLPVFAEETESIVLTPFDIILSEDDFTAQGPNHNILVQERGQSATINIVLKNNDNESHQITMKDPRPPTSKLFDSFRFEPEQVTVLAHQKNSTKLHITISEDTNVHSSFVTFLAQSNTFGMKGIGFVLVVDGELDELVDKSLRSGLPGPAFPRMDTQISEDEAEKMIDTGYGAPNYLPKGYQFRGMTDWGDSKQFVYSPSSVENSTESTSFWKNGGMLISYYNYIDRPNVNNTKSLPVRIAQDEGQQVMINGMMGMAIEKQTRVVAYTDMEYDVPAEVDFFDDTKRVSVDLMANMPLDDLLKVASSIPVFEEDSTSEENSEKPNDHLLDLTKIAPLKQFESGIPINEIQCRESLILVIKNNGSPACVKPETVPKLIERGWITNNDENSVTWKKYITISASRIDESSLHDMLIVYHMNEILQNPILNQLFDGADGCKNETEMCALSRGVSLVRISPFGIQVSDHDDYTITLDEEQTALLYSQLEWTTEGNWIYTIIESQEKYYLLMLSTFDNVRTPDVKMKLIGTLLHPVNLERGEILNYTIQVDTWATYGSPAKIDLVAIQSTKDSGINVWIEPDVLVISERSNATATLFIQAKDDAKDGIYDVRVIGHANEKLAGLYCSNTLCPTVNIGDSDWSIRTFGSGTNRGIGGGQHPENTWVELELNKKEFFKEDMVEIKAYIVNNSTEKIEFIPRDLLIKVIKAQPVGYYENLYGIDARYESDDPIILEPNSKTLLVRPFYWNQNTFQNFDDEHRLDPRQHKMIVTFVGENYAWNGDVWFEIK